MAPGTEPAQLQTADVLTLHRSVWARWRDGQGAVAARWTAGAGAASGRHETWMQGLGALAMLGGQSSPRAWAVAEELAVSPRVAALMSPALRTLQLGELADLVQVVLEELEPPEGVEDDSVLDDTVAQARRQLSAATRTQAADAGPRAAPQRAQPKPATRRPPAQAAKLHELRRLLAALQRHDTVETAKTGGDTPPQVLGQRGSADPLGAATASEGGDRAAASDGSAATSAATMASRSVATWPRVAPGPAAESPLLRALRSVTGTARRGTGASARTTVGQWMQRAATPRALRWAEQAADLDMVGLQADATPMGDEAAGAGSDWAAGPEAAGAAAHPGARPRAAGRAIPTSPLASVPLLRATSAAVAAAAQQLAARGQLNTRGNAAAAIAASALAAGQASGATQASTRRDAAARPGAALGPSVAAPQMVAAAWQRWAAATQQAASARGRDARVLQPGAPALPADATADNVTATVDMPIRSAGVGAPRAASGLPAWISPRADAAQQGGWTGTPASWPGVTAAASAGWVDRLGDRLTLGMDPASQEQAAAAPWSEASDRAAPGEWLSLGAAGLDGQSVEGTDSEDGPRSRPGGGARGGPVDVQATARTAAAPAAMGSVRTDRRIAGEPTAAAQATVTSGTSGLAAGLGGDSRRPMRVHAALAAAESVWQAQQQLQRAPAGAHGDGQARGPVAWLAALASAAGPLAMRPEGRADALTGWLQQRSAAQGKAEGAAPLDAEWLKNHDEGNEADTAAALQAAASNLRDGAVGDGALRGGDLQNGAVRSGARRGSAAGDGGLRDGRLRDGRLRDGAPATQTRGAAADWGAARRPGAAPRAAAYHDGQAAAPRTNHLAALALQTATPKALRAILAALGETETPAAADAATVFAARWLGRADVARKALVQMAKLAAAAGGGELLASSHDDGGVIEGGTASAAQRDLATRTGTAAAATQPRGAAAWAGLIDGRKTTSAVAEAAGDGEVVLTGLAALAALTGGALSQQPPRSMQIADAERTLVEQPAGWAGTAEDSSAAATEPAEGLAGPRRAATAARDARLAAVKVHDFAPVGLRRGRNLTGQQRRAQGLHTTARSGSGVADIQTTIRNLSRLASARRVGYGAAGLGGGELVGLTDGDPMSYFGDAAPTPSALRGADRLSHAVAQRRAATMARGGGNGGQPSVAKSAASEPFEGVPVLPSDFRYGDAASTVEDAFASSGRSSGATSAARSSQAAAMTRVLSVTDAPSAQVLPLVAPAAQAVVTAAAAKSWSDSLVTSGGDPTMGLPIASTGSRKAGASGKQGGEGGGGGSGGEQGDQAQDIEALAMKIARSVMVRIKRERERRGLHE